MVPSYYEFHCSVKILCGRKALANLPHELSSLGAAKPLVITDKGVVAAGLLKRLLRAFKDAGTTTGPIFDETPVDSGVSVVNRIAGIYRAEGCDAIVALGGGSVMDTAKGVNIVISEGSEDLAAFQGVDRLSATMKPLIAIPTTAGTGSEVTSAAVIFDDVDSKEKIALVSARLMPHVAIVDPALMETMPPRVTAATGMDALTHAVEAATGVQKNPMSDAFASAAIRMVAAQLVPAVEDGGNGDARLAMANAALLAGIAFSNSMVGVVHALAHATGAICHVPHGVANGILLPHGMRYNLEARRDAYAEIADMAGISGNTTKARADGAVAWVEGLQSKLNRLCEFPTRLRDVGVAEADLEKIANVAQNDGSITYNPTEADAADLLGILRGAW